MESTQTTIAGRACVVRAIDLRTFAQRSDCDAAPPAHAGECLSLACVADLEDLVDRDELLRNAQGVEPPYWALPWIGARAIAAELQPVILAEGAKVLDLGCGLGLAGVAAGLAGGRVTFADYVPDALAFAQANAAMHALDGFELTQLDFTRDRIDARFDWLLAADVVYDPAYYDGLVESLDVQLAASGTLLLTESLRADSRSVIEKLAARGIRGLRKDVWLREDERSERTWLHVLRRA